MPSYIVQSCEEGGTWESEKGGTMQAWNLVLIDGQGEYKCQANTKLGNEFPAEGQSVEGEFTEAGSDRPKRFKKAYTKPPAEGWKPRDPKETTQIVVQHSQQMAIMWAAIKQKESATPTNFGYDWLEQAIEWFTRNAKGEPQR